MTAPQRHRRQTKTSHEIGVVLTADDLACGKAVMAFDEASRRMDLKWGHERVVGHAPPELAAKFGSAVAFLNDRMESSDVAGTVAAVTNCLKGFAAMDAAAEAAGAPKADPSVLEYDLDGFRIGIMRDGGSWQAAKASHPDLRLYTMREAAVALQAVSIPAVEAVKDHFPGARITAAAHPKKPPVNYDLGGDEIPW